jgi:hypothetical protein
MRPDICHFSPPRNIVLEDGPKRIAAMDEVPILANRLL